MRHAPCAHAQILRVTLSPASADKRLPPHRFVLCTASREYHLSAPSEPDLTGWLTALRKAVAQGM